jgi:uncharacterized RDD family membrane protein YckC
MKVTVDGKDLDAKTAIIDRSKLTETKPEHGPQGSEEFAGFWDRVAAYQIDITILGLVFLVPLDIKTLNGVFTLIGFQVVATFVYFTVMNSSYQGTLGKKVLRLRLTSIDGDKISLLRSHMRMFVLVLSSFTMGIGYLMIVFTQKKQGLHDFIVKTQVVRDGPKRSPGFIVGAIVLALIGYSIEIKPYSDKVALRVQEAQKYIESHPLPSFKRNSSPSMRPVAPAPQFSMKFRSFPKVS